MRHSLRLLGIGLLLVSCVRADDDDEEQGEIADLTEEQFEMLHSKIDEDKDGNLSTDELYFFSNASRYALAQDERYTDHILSRLDKDGDGQLDLEDETMGTGAWDKIKMAAADTNEDGQLSGEELPYVFAPSLNEDVLDKVLSSILAQMDKDEDGKVSKEELKQTLGEMYQFDGGQGKTLYLPEYVNDERVLIEADEDGMYLVKNKKLQKSTTGLGYRTEMELGSKDQSKEAKWDSKVEGIMVDGWLQVNASLIPASDEEKKAEQKAEKLKKQKEAQEKRKNRGKAVFLPEYIAGERVLTPQGESGVFLVESSLLESQTTGLGYRYSRTLEDKHDKKVATWGFMVKGNLTDEWLEVAKTLQRASLGYLPEYINATLVLSPTEDSDVFSVVKPDLETLVNTTGLGYRHTRSPDNKVGKQVAWGQNVRGVLSDGWMRVNFSQEVEVLYLPEFVNDSLVLSPTEDDDVFLVLQSATLNYTTGLGFRNSRNLADRHGRREATWGMKVQGKLSAGWLQMEKSLGRAQIVYLPEFINGSRVLSPTEEDPFVFTVDKPDVEVLVNTSGLGYRKSQDLEDKLARSKNAAWGSTVNGVLAGGWLRVDRSRPATQQHGKAVFLPEFVLGQQVLTVTEDPHVFVVESSLLEGTTSGLGFRYRKFLDAKHGTKEVAWGSKIQGNFTSGWLAVDKILGKVPVAYLPQFINASQVLSSTETPNVFLVAKPEVPALVNTTGLGFRNTRRLDDQHGRKDVSWGMRVRGTLADGWLRVNLSEEVEVVYLPEFINESRVLLATQEPGVFLVDNPVLQVNTTGLGFRSNMSLDNKHSRKEVVWGTKIKGVLADGFVQVEKVLGKARIMFLPEYINESRVVLPTEEANIFLIEKPDMEALENTSGLGYRVGRLLQQKHSRKEATWGGKIRGLLADGWLQVDFAQDLEGEVLYLPEFVNEERVLTETNDTSIFLVDSVGLKTRTTGLGFRYSRSLEHKHVGKEATWGSKVRGVLADGWMQVDKITEKPKKASAAAFRKEGQKGRRGKQEQEKPPPFMYLPEYINGEKVLHLKDRGSFTVENVALNATNTGVGFRYSKKLEDKHQQYEAKWGETVPGVLSDGWLTVEFNQEEGGDEEQDGDVTHQAFRDLDKDKDGHISKIELTPFATGSFEHEISMEQVIDALDKNKDGQVTLEELVNSNEALKESEAIYHVMDWIQHHEL